MILNQDVHWHSLEPHVQAAFQTKFGMPEKVLLSPGFVLYKFNDFRTLHGPSSNALSPWWSPYEPFKHDGGWVQRSSLAKNLGVSIREWGRLTSAVKENWNSLNYLLVITTKVPMYGFFGGFAQMSRIDEGTDSKMGAGEGRGKSKNLPGGGTQIYIPNLTADDVSSWRVEDLSSQ